MSGALEGIRVVEIGGLGPAPFCSMMLADHGADVIRIERPDKVQPKGAEVKTELIGFDVLSRGRHSAGIDLKHPSGVQLVGELAAGADVFIEGFRPGVAERLGIGPELLCEANPKLIYGRMTGWGRSGSMSERAGHDINYISLAGVQAHIGRAGQPPTPPLNLVGDFGGGGMLLAFGICAALVRRGVTGQGQVVDAAMVDGAALLMAPLFGASASGFWHDEAGTNLLDSGAPFYDCYECSDGRYISIGALEPQFYAALLTGLGLSDHPDLPPQMDSNRWGELRELFTNRVLTKSMAEWAEVFRDVDACVVPVLTMGEAVTDPHLAEWGTFMDLAGTTQPAPAPRMSESPAVVEVGPQTAGANTDEVLARWGIDDARISALHESGAIR